MLFPVRDNNLVLTRPPVLTMVMEATPVTALGAMRENIVMKILMSAQVHRASMMESAM